MEAINEFIRKLYLNKLHNGIQNTLQNISFNILLVLLYFVVLISIIKQINRYRTIFYIKEYAFYRSTTRTSIHRFLDCHQTFIKIHL